MGNIRRGAGAQARQHASTPGNTVMLSIDIKLQKLVEDLASAAGAGRHRSAQRRGSWPLYPSPPSTPICLSMVSDSESWAALNEDVDKPLLNRALRGTYPPGSTWQAVDGHSRPQQWQACRQRGHPGQPDLQLRRAHLWQP